MTEYLPILLLLARALVSLIQWVVFQSSFLQAIHQRSKHHSCQWVDLSWGSQDPSSLLFLWFELKHDLYQDLLQPIVRTQSLPLWHAVSLLWGCLTLLYLCGLLDDLLITWKKFRSPSAVTKKEKKKGLAKSFVVD